MTIQCRCGVLLSAELDGIMDDHREIRLQARFGKIIVEHVAKHHKDDLVRAHNLSQFYLSWALLTQFTSTDPKFAAWVEEGRKMLSNLVAPPDAGQAEPIPANQA